MKTSGIALAGCPGQDTIRADALVIMQVAALATSLDLATAIAYWGSQGVAAAQVLRSVAAWALGPDPPATAPVLALGVVVLVLIYLGMAVVLRQLLAAPGGHAARPFLAGALYGTAAYVLVFQLLVPILVQPASVSRPPAWILCCLALHALVIGPLMVSRLGAAAVRSRGRRK